MKKLNINLRRIFFFFLASQLMACEFTSKDYEFKKAQKFEAQKKYSEAIQYYYKYLRKNEDSANATLAAKKIYEIASISNASPQVLENSLKYILLNSDSSDERLEAQFELANHYFEKLNDYESAINHFNKYISLSKNKEKIGQARLKIAKSYFYTNNFYQAKVEIEELLKEVKITDSLKYEANFLFGNVLQSEKHFDKAIQTYTNLIAEFPNRAEKEEVYLNLSLCYEDSKRFQEAIEVLLPYTETHMNPEFIKEKINKIRFLISQQPGARGKIK